MQLIHVTLLFFIAKKLTETEILEQSRDYRTRLRDCPHDINLWIDYINFQVR